MRLSMRAEIGRRRTGAEVELSHAARNQGRVLELAAPYGTVDSFLDEICTAFAAAELQIDVRIAGEEIRQRRHQDQPRDERGCIDPQSAAGCSMVMRQRLFGLADLRQYGDAARIVGSPVGGHADAAGRAVQQLHAE